MQRAELEIDRRMDALNHLRADMLTKGDFTAQHGLLMGEFRAEASSLRAEVGALKEWKAEQSGKASVTSVYLSYAIALGALLVSISTLAHAVMK